MVGFKDWKHATGKSGVLSKHDSSFAHRQSVLAWNQYKLNMLHKTTISDQLGLSRNKQIAENPHYIWSLAEIILMCSYQEIALRGHKEGEESMNRGNFFLEILNLIANHDSVIKERLMNGTKNAKYTSPDVQNTIINVMSTIVQESICSAVHKAGAFTILADKTKDCSKREQLAIVIRYVDVDKAELFERFLTFVEAASLDASSLSAFILDTLKKNDLDPQCLVSQGYDGASVMSGRCAEVQQKVYEVVPHAVYMHCYAHCLNLVLVDSARFHLQHLIFLLSWKSFMCFCHEALHMLFSSESSPNSIQISNTDSCKDCQTPVGLVGTQPLMQFVVHLTQF